jgi:hypothetical protein
MKINHLAFAAMLGIATACTFKAPNVIDRHTIMEDEAAGEWPDFEKDSRERTETMGPTAFQKVDNSAKKARLYNVLNGELANRGKEPAKK